MRTTTFIAVVAAVITAYVNGPVAEEDAAARGAVRNLPTEAGAIFFSRNDGGMAINSDGTGLIKLRDAGQISPDGRKVLSGRDVVDLASSRRHRLFLPNEAYDEAWSQDGTAIAYRYTGGAGSLLYRIDVSTGERAQLTRGPNDTNPSWSPDGQTIAFQRGLDLYLMRSDGNDQRLFRRGVSTWAWAPDGTRLAFVQEVGGFYDQIYIAELGSSHLDATVGPRTESTLELAWSPSGSHLAFSALVGGETGAFIVNPDGSGLRRIVRGGDEGTSRPAWSPDGTKLAVSFGTPADVWVFNLDRPGGKRLTKGHVFGNDNTDPEWDPQGRPTSGLPGSPETHGTRSASVAVDGLLKTRARISALAAEGRRVGYVLREECDSVEHWSVGARVTPFPAQTFDCSSGGGAGISSIAMVDRAVTWVTWQQTNHRDFGVWQARPSRPNPYAVHSATDVELGELFANGGAAFFVRRDRVAALWRIAGRRARKVATRPAIDGVAAEAGLVVIWNGREIEVLTNDGRMVRKHKRSGIDALRVAKGLLVTFNGRTLATLDARSGRKLRSHELAGWQLADAEGEFAALVRGGAVLIIDVRTGRRTAIATPGRSVPLADVERPGMYYSYPIAGRRYPGRIALARTAQIVRRLR